MTDEHFQYQDIFLISGYVMLEPGRLCSVYVLGLESIVSQQILILAGIEVTANDVVERSLAAQRLNWIFCSPADPVIPRIVVWFGSTINAI